jgi:psiF repeat
MKKIILALCLALFAASLPVAAEQTDHNKACNAEATKKALKADKRQAFLKNCLAAKAKSKSENTVAAPETKKTKPAGSPNTGAASSKPDSAATPPATNPGAVSAKARLRCDELARQSNVSPGKKNDFMSKCMAG